MLLVDDHETEVPERHRFLDEGVGPDDDLRVPLLDAAHRGPALGGRHRSGQDLHAVAPPREQRREAPVMLLGEDLGGRHQRRLSSVLDRHQHRQQGDDRLARADISLQETAHRPGRGQVGDDLLEDLLLRAREVEGQHGRQLRAHRGGRRVRDRPSLVAVTLPAQPERELQQEEFLEDESLVGPRRAGLVRLEVGPLGWEVDLAKRPPAGHQPAALAQRRRQRIGHLLRKRDDDVVEDRPHHAR